MPAIMVLKVALLGAMCFDCAHKAPAVDCLGRTREEVGQDAKVSAEMKRLWNEQNPERTMWMTEYVREIKRALRDQHHLEPSRVVEGEPLFDNLHDGDYPMVIVGRLDRVRVVNGRFECCRFDEPVSRAAARCRYEMWCNDSKGKPLLLGWGNDPKEFAEMVEKWPGKSTFRAIDLRLTEQGHGLTSQG